MMTSYTVMFNCFYEANDTQTIDVNAESEEEAIALATAAMNKRKEVYFLIEGGTDDFDLGTDRDCHLASFELEDVEES